MFNILNIRQKGFTLIELLVVIAIIGMLSAVTLASLGSARAKARNAQRRSDFAAISKALTLYFDKFGYMPPNITGTSAGCAQTDPTEYKARLQPLVTNGFLSKIPLGPQNDYCYYNYGPGSLDGALLVTALEGVSSQYGEAGSCRNWHPPTNNWCQTNTVNSYYCICNPH